jgi:hypothetical protein
MRRTKKYGQAEQKARELFTPFQLACMSVDGVNLYQALESQGFFWDAESSTWTNTPRSTSIFTTDEGAPTGEFRLRVMGHPDELDVILNRVLDGLRYGGCAVTEISDRFKNHKGPGYRVYVTCQLRKS